MPTALRVSNLEKVETAERQANSADGERRTIEQAASSSASSSSPPSQITYINKAKYYNIIEISQSIEISYNV